MKKEILFGLLLLATTLQAGNKIYSPMVKTLTTIVNNDWQNRPVMELGSRDVLHIGFDELSHDSHRYICHLTRCEADWSETTDVFESDWLQGFNDFPLDDYQNSLNTTVNYTHYEFTIPNSQCMIRMSGNYRLSIFDEDNGHEKILDAEFYVVEPVVNIGLNLTTNTDIDVNKSHQQVSINLEYKDLNVIRPEDEIYTVVMQNWNEQTARLNPAPQYTYHQGLRWEHQRELIFDAGNEYHKFEVLDVSHPTMGIDRIGWDGKRYQAFPFTTTVRRNYLTDESANGAFYIRNSNRSEIAYTCDYVWVNYTLEAPYSGEIFLQGQWTNNADATAYQMQYDANSQCYMAQVMQKQGYYSYQYVDKDGHTAPTEGNFFQTRNKYQVLVYYKGLGDRTWRLVGYRGLVAR
ncbi:MAG: DUF5103 domain-containing protein [Prevotella sp.]|nr:DUF5103 domain-containing protein [Prevotella sp.]